MSTAKTKLIKAALSAMYYSGTHKALEPLAAGVGVIFTMHHVRPEAAGAFEPNRILKVTPEFLETVIDHVQKRGFDIVSLDEAHWRLAEGQFERPFTCFTFDDGYRDNALNAYPIFRRRGLPFAIYVPTDYADGKGDLWWLALERVIADVDELRVTMQGERRTFRCDDIAGKERAYETVYWWLRGSDEGEARAFVRELCREVGYDPLTLCRDLVMNWDELRTLARDPLVTIGAHTRSHYALAKLSLGQARLEMEESINRIEREIGVRPRHFSYPYGCEGSAGPREFQLARELGMKTAVTTRKGVVCAEHSNHLTALPRVSLNGDFQDRRFVSVFLSGAPFFIWNGMRRMVAA
jgi:peptidoglycan/xylan/chitin deacetylase (PgdA/CDA1 family)